VVLSYDNAGRLSGHRDENNNLTAYGYGALGLQTTRTDALAQVDTFAYDIAGQLSRITDRMGQVTGLAYDARNRLSQRGFGATVANPTTYISTLGLTYDAGDRVT
jgi:YD repeat-containing protein